MIPDIFLIILALAALVFASITDLRTKEVPDWLSYGLIIAGLGVRLIYSLISLEWNYFLYGVLGFLSMAGLGVILYYLRQWGGGDAKLIMGLGAVFATRPYYLSGSWPFLVDIFINLLVFGSLYGLAWTFTLFIRNRNRVFSESRKILAKKRKSRLIYSAACLIFLVLVMIFFGGFQRIILLSALAFFYMSFYLFIFVRAVEKVGMYRRTPVSSLTEGDWIAEEVKVGDKVICGPNDLGITNKQIARLKKSNIHKVLVKEGMAFVPSFLIAVSYSLIFGNILFFL